MGATVKVKCFNGKAYDVDVSPESDSVSDLQSRIADVSEIAAERQTLLFKGQVLDSSAPVSDYPIESGVTISVVRRVGKAPPAAASKPKAKPAASTPPATDITTPRGAAGDSAAPATMPMPGMAGLGGMPGLGGGAGGGAGDMAAMEAMMRSLGMGGDGGGGMPGMPPGMGGMGGGGGGGGGMVGMPPGLEALAGGAAGAGAMEKLMSQMPAMMKGLMQSDALKDYLSDPQKQEASRDAIMNNPMLKQWLESDPEFAKVVNDPDQWKKSMDAAKTLFTDEDADADSLPTAGRGFDPKKPLAAAQAPPGLNMGKLSESYGHALGQSLVNSGLGLEPDLVMKGFRAACNGDEFPMPLPEYERAMAQLQSVAAEFLQEANLKDANQFFDEIKADDQNVMVVLEQGKIAYERGDVEPDAEQPVALDSSTVLVIVTARLLDGRHFFTCPAADETGDTVHPLTLPLDTAPPALRTGIKGMKETESRLLYVHPTAAEGMADMFGDLLPPNALLIFDLQLVSANAPEEEVAAVKEAAEAATVR